MAVPDFQSLMRPLLVVLEKGESKRFANIVPLVADFMNVSAEDMAVPLPSGGQGMFRNRLHWAGFYLLKAGLLTRPMKGYLQITDRGRTALASASVINNKFLRQFPEFVTFQTHNVKNDTKDDETEAIEAKTPEDLMEEGYTQHRNVLASELLAKVKTCSPAFFEQLVVDLLVGMGYGGSRKDAGSAVGRSGDGGVDGIIKEDRLGLDTVLVQAKRWEATVGRPVVQAFAGSLEGYRAKKGVLISTSDFSADARDYVSKIEKRIVLIGGTQLTDLMIEFGVGVNEVTTYVLKRIDTDYFEEE